MVTVTLAGMVRGCVSAGKCAVLDDSWMATTRVNVAALVPAPMNVRPALILRSRQAGGWRAPVGAFVMNVAMGGSGSTYTVFAEPGAEPAGLQTHAGTLLMASVPAVRLWSLQCTRICQSWQAPTSSQLRTTFSDADAKVAPTVAQRVFEVVPTAGQPQAVPVGTTPVDVQVSGELQGSVVEVTVKQPFASLVH